MVPEKLSDQNYKSIIESLNQILYQLKQSSLEKQNVILKQDWTRLRALSEEQDELLSFLDVKQKKLSLYDDQRNNGSLKDIHLTIKKSIDDYREIEADNIRMLNDTLFVAKQKVEKIFRKQSGQKTYSKDLKKESNLWNNNPAVLDKFI